MSGTPKASYTLYLYPLAWSAFVWAFLLVLTQTAGQTFYLLIRGVGAIHTSDAMVVGSPGLDSALLVLASIAVVAAHALVLRRRALWPPSLLSLVGLGVGAMGTLVHGGPLFVLLTGLGGFGAIASFVTVGPGPAKGTAGAALSSLALFLAAEGAVVSIAGAARWIVGAFDGSTPLRSPDWAPVLLGLQLNALLDPLIPEIVLIFLFSWVIRLGMPLVLRRMATPANWGSVSAAMESRGLTVALLAIGGAVAIFVSIYQYLPAVNPQGILVGVDVRYCYSNILANVPVGGPCGNNGALYELEHYGAFAMLRGLVALTGSIHSAMVAAPPLLAALMVVSTSVLAYEATGSRLVAGAAALFSGTSPELIAGVNAGLIGNWLALSLMFLFFAAVIRGLRTRKVFFVMAGSLVSILLLAVHPWTWAVSIGVVGAYLFLRAADYLVKGKLGERRLEVYILGGVILVALAADSAFALLFGRSGVDIAVATINHVLSFPTASTLSTDFRETFVMFLLGGFAAPLWFLLGAAGVLSIRSLRSEAGGLLTTWLAAISIGILAIGESADPTLVARFLYMLPFPLFEAMGFVAIVRRIGSEFEGPQAARLRVALLIAALTAVVGLQLVFTLDNVSFLYRGVPGT